MNHLVGHLNHLVGNIQDSPNPIFGNIKVRTGWNTLRLLDYYKTLMMCSKMFWDCFLNCFLNLFGNAKAYSYQKKWDERARDGIKGFVPQLRHFEMPRNMNIKVFKSL